MYNERGPKQQHLNNAIYYLKLQINSIELVKCLLVTPTVLEIRVEVLYQFYNC
jgi:hypothetical protein